MLLNFKSRFVPMILAHDKRHTIRAKRKIAPRVGETCHLYTGLRQKGAKLLGRYPCVKVQEIEIYESSSASYGCAVFIERIGLDPDEKKALAISDGFSSFAEMMEFWEGRLPFHGDIIHWDPEAKV